VGVGLWGFSVRCLGRCCFVLVLSWLWFFGVLVLFLVGLLRLVLFVCGVCFAMRSAFKLGLLIGFSRVV